MSSQLFRLPEGFLFNPGDKVAEFIDRKFEIFDNFMQSWGEGIIVDISEDIVNPAVLKQIYLYAQNQVEDGVCCLSITIGFLHFFHKHTQCEVQLVSSQF